VVSLFVVVVFKITKMQFPDLWFLVVMRGKSHTQFNVVNAGSGCTVVIARETVALSLTNLKGKEQTKAKEQAKANKRQMQGSKPITR
jgi:hypothetical protein